MTSASEADLFHFGFSLLVGDSLVMEPTIFALGLACSQVLMLTLIIAKSIYGQIKEVRMVEEKYAKPHFRILLRQRASCAQRNPTTRKRVRMGAGRTR